MFIIVNKNFSIAKIEPSTVYQGSNLANELAIFAPFSVSSYPTVELSVLLPDGRYLEQPLLAFSTETQIRGFGAWSLLLPASVTAIPGTLKISLVFKGETALIVTEAAEFTIQASVPSLPPPTPDQTVYDQILSALAAILERHPDWDETNAANPSYIANKPPVKAVKVNGETVGAEVKGNLSADSLEVDGNSLETLLDGKLDKVDPETVGTYLYKVEKNNSSTSNGIISVRLVPTSGAIPMYDAWGNLGTSEPRLGVDCVNLKYFNEHIPVRLTYNGTNGVLSITDVNNNVIGSVDLPLEMTVSGAAYENGNLVITFTNGDVVTIPLEDLILPEWVTDLDNIPSGSGNIPPTADAVKTYVDSNTASAIKGEVSGGAILLDDISPLNNTVSISTSPNVSTVGIFGRNLVIADQIVKSTNASNGTLTIEGNEIVLGENTIYGITVTLPNPIPAGTVVSYSFEWSSDSVDDNEKLEYIQFGSVQSAALKTFYTQEGSFSPDFEMTRFRIFKKSPSIPSTAPIYISNLCLNIGTEAVFTPFENKIDLQLTNGRGTYTAEGGRDISIIPPTESTVTAEYYRDSTKVINKLSRQIIALQNIVT